MHVAETAAKAAIELSDVLKKIKDEQVQKLIDEICEAKRIYVAGAGRSLLMLRCFAMRLMHLGFESYVVGDTTTPAFEPGDLLIIGSGSGETSTVLSIANKAKKIGGTIAVITIKADSSLGRMADLLVEIPGYTNKVDFQDLKRPIMPSGSLFEQSLLLLGDAVVIPLAEKKGIPLDKPFSRHANLE